MFQERQVSLKKKTGICLGFPTFDPSQCQQQNKNPQHLDTFKSFELFARETVVLREPIHTH